MARVFVHLNNYGGNYSKGLVLYTTTAEILEPSRVLQSVRAVPWDFRIQLAAATPNPPHVSRCMHQVHLATLLSNKRVLFGTPGHIALQGISSNNYLTCVHYHAAVRDIML